MTRQDLLRDESSSFVGCHPERVGIFDDTGRTWVAVCNGKKFHCSHSGGGSHIAGTTHCAEESGSPPASAKLEASPALSSDPMTIHVGSARFTVPGGFRADAYKGHKTYHPSSGWGRFVYLDVESHSGNADAYAADKFADRKVKKLKVEGIAKVFATKSQTLFDSKMQVTTMIEIVDGDAYALTCAAGEEDDGGIPSFCAGVFKSFRLGEGD
jgi:hypothetical protein